MRLNFLALIVCSSAFSQDLGEIVESKVTAYCPCEKCCSVYSDGVTSTGRSAKLRGAAVDPKAIPYGSYLEVPGVPGKVLVDDTGGAMRRAWKKGRYHIDLRFQKHSEALVWGVREVKVIVYRRKK